MKKFLTILILCISSLAQTNLPLPTRQQSHENDYVSIQSKHWVSRHPVWTGLGIAAGLSAGWILTHPSYYCYSDVGSEGIYKTYTGTPSGQKGPHGCPPDQVSRVHYF